MTIFDCAMQTCPTRFVDCVQIANKLVSQAVDRLLECVEKRWRIVVREQQTNDVKEAASTSLVQRQCARAVDRVHLVGKRLQAARTFSLENSPPPPHLEHELNGRHAARSNGGVQKRRAARRIDDAVAANGEERARNLGGAIFARTAIGDDSSCFASPSTHMKSGDLLSASVWPAPSTSRRVPMWQRAKTETVCAKFALSHAAQSSRLSARAFLC